MSSFDNIKLTIKLKFYSFCGFRKVMFNKARFFATMQYQQKKRQVGLQKRLHSIYGLPLP